MAIRLYTLAGILGAGNKIPTRLGEEPFYVAQVYPSEYLALSPVPEARVLANGVEIIGYHLEGRAQPGQRFEWWIAWRVREPPPERNVAYHIFNHLVDGHGVLLSQADEPTVPVKDWAVGDVVVQVFELEVPATVQAWPLSMRVGMYTYPEIRNQPVLDVAGKPVAEAVTLGPLGMAGE